MLGHILPSDTKPHWKEITISPPAFLAKDQLASDCPDLL